MQWNSIVIVICLLLAAFAVYREYNRENKVHLSWRIVFAIIAVTAIACVALPLTYTGTSSPAGKSKILLTTGYDKDSLPENDSIYTLAKTIHKQYTKAKLLTSLPDLFGDSSHITPVNIFGYGLDNEDLKDLAGRPIIFHPSTIPDGFTAISWTDKIKTGQSFQVQGTYQNSSTNSYKLLLRGLNTSLDSVTIPAKSNFIFSLKSIPKNSGRIVYDLLVLTKKDTLQQEQLPFIIEPAKPIIVLMLSASPDFETKFLRYWLGNNGYGVASRSVITKGKFGQDYVNMDQPDLTHITIGLLGKFDVVIGDLSVLKSLNPAENLALQQEVLQKGLGVIVRSDSSDKKNSWLQSNFSVNYQAGKQQLPATLSLLQNGKTAKLNIDPINLIQQNNTQPLITDEQNHLLAGVALSGAGKVVFTTINNTYTWSLAGNQKDYSALWSLLIDKATRKLPPISQWYVATSLIKVNQRAQLVSESNTPLSGTKTDQLPVYPSQNPSVPYKQQYSFWPANYGWHQTVQSNAQPFWWFTWPNKAWLSIKAAQNLVLTRRYAKSNPVNNAVTKQIQQKISLSVPKIYFYILFLVAVMFLWIESKFYSS